MWKCYIITLCLNVTLRNKRQDDVDDNLYLEQQLVYTCIAPFGLVGPKRALPFLKTSANTLQLVNSELSDKFDLRRHENNKRGAFTSSLLMNTVTTTPFEGTFNADHGMML